ncbi:hypothetical protein MZD50_00035 [Escherichia coli]|nr:hypothetical protein [Escherichia coli]MBZ8430993.1 hypothetical protein [Escherichia coli]MCQ6211178.1 hypothetical protein [Escherichia coli]MCQ6215893.1 hypothetical protein [Escherichia coli]
MELKDRIIAAKCENDPVFRERYLLASVKPLAVVQDLMRRGCSDPAAQQEAREAIINAVDLLLLHPEAVGPLFDVVREAHRLTWPQAQNQSEALNIIDLEKQVEDEF